MKRCKNTQNKSKIKGCFICFTGIDGSGKSTMSAKLVDVMNSKGHNFIYVYNRYKPFLLRPFLYIGKNLFLKDKDFFEDYVDYSNTKKEATKNHSLLSSIYQYSVVVDYFIQSLYKIRIPLLLGENIICDRYIYDTVVTDLAVDFNYSKSKIDKVSRLMQLFFPIPYVTFFIDAPEEIAYSRKDDIPSIDYLKDRRKNFMHIAHTFNMIKLDGTKKIDEILYDIEKELKID
jgi:thymidylate kinase